MIDREFYQAQLGKYQREEAGFRKLAAEATDHECREFYTRQADRAAAYAADYEQDLAR